MPKWTKPSEGHPECYAGDRVVLIVQECAPHTTRLENRIVILEATEDGWRCDDPTYAGYGIEDSVLWSMEKDVCQIADIVN